MAVDQFKDISFPENSPLDPLLLNQMAVNTRWIYERTPRMLYSAYEQVEKDDGLKIAAGVAAVNSTKNAQTTRNIYFPSFFTTGCHPVVVVSLIIPSSAYRAHAIVRGIGADHPDSRGFSCILASNEIDPKNNGFPQATYVSWIAVGY